MQNSENMSLSQAELEALAEVVVRTEDAASSMRAAMVE